MEEAMKIEEHGNSVPDVVLDRIPRIISDIIRFDKRDLPNSVDIAIANADVFWETASAVYNDIDYEGENLRPYIRHVLATKKNPGSISIFLKSKETGTRDIMLFIVIYQANKSPLIQLGSILNVAKNMPAITCPKLL